MPVYLVGPDEGLDSQVILHQFLHVGLCSNQRGELRSNEARGYRQRGLIGSTRRSTGVSVPEKHIPRLDHRRREGGRGVG